MNLQSVIASIPKSRKAWGARQSIKLRSSLRWFTAASQQMDCHASSPYGALGGSQ